ncbi:alpha/beta hydrolase-fold protein [candidate division KSB1 bacterium]
MRLKKRVISFVIILIVAALSIQSHELCAQGTQSKLRFEISFPSSVHPEPITGRVFVMISRTDATEPRMQAGSWNRSVPFFGVDVNNLRPGSTVVIDENVLGYPPESLSEISKGDYYVQALVNVYTEFHRSDGNVIWAHMDQWEGQQLNRSPGNLYSDVGYSHLDPDAGYTVRLNMNRVIPPIEVPEDTQWVKRIKIQSDMLTEFWGHPIYIGATVLLPKGYDTHPDVYYPVHYMQGHFSLSPPHGFEEGNRFYQTWVAEDFPRMFCVTFQHPCPYFDDSYAVNSANCGPYGDALVNEMIPYLEERFRMIKKPYARVLSGGSTGGWESLAVQLFYPDFFGGAWVFYPDPIDFRYYILTNIYEDDNAFYTQSASGWMTYERPFQRDVHGQVQVTMKELSRMEAVLGSKGRSGQQLDIWQAVYGPVGDDGYPMDIWNKLTGEIDHDVAAYFREHYDLVHYIKTNWSWLGPKLVGKLYLLCGDMDNYYLNEAVLELEDFLTNTTDPYYAGSFQYGRPRAGHGWSPYGRNSGIRERVLAEHMRNNAPPGEDTSRWNYR